MLPVDRVAEEAIEAQHQHDKVFVLEFCVIGSVVCIV